MKLSRGRVRILLDTNILVAGLLSPKGPPAKLIRAWLDGRFELVTSHEQLGELARVLNYEKLSSRIDPAQKQEILGHIDALAVIAENLPEIAFSKDPADNVILASAVAGNADLIISGDKPDMLALIEIHGIPIVTAREAMNRLGLTGE